MMIYSCKEYANAEKLQQDHPCVIHLIRKQYLRQPAPRSQPYLHLLNNGDVLDDPSDGQSKGILRILRNQVKKSLNCYLECLDWWQCSLLLQI